MKKKLKKGSSIKPDVVYDDDTDSSDSDNLQSFRQNYKSQQKKRIHEPSSSDADDEVNENTSDDDDTSEAGSNSSNDDDISSEEESESERNIVKNEKLETLQKQLKSLDKVSVGTENSSQNKNKTQAQYSDPSINQIVPSLPSVAEKIKDSAQPVASKQFASPDKERLAIREELSKMSMEEILQLKEKLGSKLYNRALSSNSAEINDIKSQKHGKDEMKRDNKNRPREMSSKKTVKRYRDVVGVSAENKHEKRDPRFDSMCGEFDEKIHKDAYRFVEDIKAKELSDLKKDLNTEDDPEKIKQIKYLIQRIENQNRERKKVEGMKQSEKEQKKRNRELIKEGKAPEFVSKEEKKNLKIVEKYEELKSSNKLDQYMKKKNKKELGKERKRLKTIDME